jgi:hypothetical protein
MQNFTFAQALNFWHIRTLLASSLTEAADIIPRRAIVCVALASFKHLGVSHGLAGVVSGFDHTLLDAAQTGWHRRDFPYPVGMYAHTLLSVTAPVTTVDFRVPAHDINASTIITCSAPGVCHGIIAWVDFDLGNDITVSTAPRPAPDGKCFALPVLS